MLKGIFKNHSRPVIIFNGLLIGLVLGWLIWFLMVSARPVKVELEVPSLSPVVLDNSALNLTQRYVDDVVDFRSMARERSVANPEPFRQY